MPRLLIATTIPRMLDDFLLPYAAHFRREGWTVDALTSSKGHVIGAHHFSAIHVVDWSRNPFDPRNLWAAPTAVRRVVSTGGYDIVHVHTPVAAFVTRFALRHRPQPGRPRVIYTAHGFHFHPGGNPMRNAAFVTLEKTAGRWTDYLVVMNDEDLASAKRFRLVSRDRIRRMPGIGVDIGHYSPDSVSDADVFAFRSGFGLGDAPAFLMVAEFIERKRHTDLLTAFSKAAAHPSMSNARLLLAGSGPLEHSIRETAARLGIGNSVVMLGHRRDVPVLMKAAAAVILPSAQEGLPRCILEAMSMGVPAIATRIRGSTELLEQGRGYLFSTSDTDALAAHMTAVLTDPADATVRARRAREYVKQYAMSHVVRLHEHLYAEALGVDASPATKLSA